MTRRSLRIDAGELWLPGALVLPERPAGLVLLAHEGGAARPSARHRLVAAALERDLATVRFDLLDAEEEARDRTSGRLRCDVPLLTRRWLGVLAWAARDPATRHLALGLMASGGAAAAALVAAAERRHQVGAVVAWAGRLDLAGDALPSVYAPTLLLASGDDRSTLVINRVAAGELGGVRELVVLPGAGRRLVDPGALVELGEHARRWFVRHLDVVEARPIT